MPDWHLEDPQTVTQKSCLAYGNVLTENRTHRHLDHSHIWVWKQSSGPSNMLITENLIKITLSVCHRHYHLRLDYRLADASGSATGWCDLAGIGDAVIYLTGLIHRRKSDGESQFIFPSSWSVITNGITNDDVIAQWLVLSSICYTETFVIYHYIIGC